MTSFVLHGANVRGPLDVHVADGLVPHEHVLDVGRPVAAPTAAR